MSYWTGKANQKFATGLPPYIIEKVAPIRRQGQPMYVRVVRNSTHWKYKARTVKGLACKGWTFKGLDLQRLGPSKAGPSKAGPSKAWTCKGRILQRIGPSKAWTFKGCAFKSWTFKAWTFKGWTLQNCIGNLSENEANARECKDLLNQTTIMRATVCKPR